ncbi:hypothetical protein STEG23_003877, partial [Scotinomys teguina]
MMVMPLGRDQDCSLKNREPDVPLSWFLDPGGWSKAAVVRLYFIFPGICTLSLLKTRCASVPKSCRDAAAKRRSRTPWLRSLSSAELSICPRRNVTRLDCSERCEKMIESRQRWGTYWDNDSDMPAVGKVGSLWEEEEAMAAGVRPVCSLEISADAHVRGYVGENVRLRCTFKSSSDVTDKLTIDWTYRPPSSSRTESIFHYQSFQYPTTAGTFRDRISWVGNVYKGDASISISKPTLKDNGTFSCAVKNPPDVYHNIPLTELTVTERGFGTMLSSVALLSILVFIPSAVVVILLLVRMGRKATGVKKRSRSGYKKSSIEVSDDTDQEDNNDCVMRLCVRCAECLVLKYSHKGAISLIFPPPLLLLCGLKPHDIIALSAKRYRKLESSMLYLLKLIVIPAILGVSWGLADMTVSSRELRVHVGDSAFMGCFVQSSEEKQVVKVDWTLSRGEYAENEYVLYYYSNLSVPTGRFQNRSRLVGDISRNDGSLLLQNVQEADQGNYTCEIRRKSESVVFKDFVKLHVLPEEPKELTVYVGDSTPMGCFFQSTKEKHVTKVDWMFSSGKHAKEEVVWRYDFNSYDFNTHSGYFQSKGRFRNRVNLIGDISRNDGSIMLQPVKESDQGVYTCRIYLGKLESRKTIVLRVVQEESQMSISTTPRPEANQKTILDGNQLVIIVGILCATLLLLPVLILIVKKTKWNESSVDSTASLKSLESKEKANPESVALSAVPPGRSMEVTVPTTLSVLNGSDTRLPCTFNSCYTVNHKQFSLNWTYQECSNCSEEMFLQFRMKIINLKLERFGDRVEFSGNPSKYDVSVTLKDVQLEDEGIYNCYITNPPDRHRGHGKIYLQVLLEVPPERDSTVAVIVGASVGGFLAVVILVLMVVKCVRRKKEQKLNTDDLKTEEEGKTD